MRSSFMKRLMMVCLVMVALTACILTAQAEEPVTAWDFRLDEFDGTLPYNTLSIEGKVKKHGAQYGMAIKDATISVPVTGPCEVQVAVGYNWDVTFPDGTQYADKTDSGDITVTYVHTGEAGTVDIKVGSEFTSYVKSITLAPAAVDAAPVTAWDFRLDEFDGTVPYNTLAITGKVKKHGAQYGMAISDATISVPVTGPCEVQVAVGYNWDVTFPDGMQYVDKTDSGDITVSYIHTGEAGTVDIRVGSEYTSYIKFIELVPVDMSGAPELDTSKVYVWDFGAEVLDETAYVNMLTVDEINRWFPGVEPGTKGGNAASFQSSDGLLVFNDGGFPTTHRLRSTNPALSRYDEKSLKDAEGNVFTGYIYSNKSSSRDVYVGIKVNAGEKITLAVGSNGGTSLINFESPSGKVATAEFTNSAKIEYLTFYPTESGVYKIYSTTEKLVLARIYREAFNDVTVSGSVTAPEGMGAYELVFTNTLSGAETAVTPENGAYAVTLKDGGAYALSLRNANGYVISQGAELTIDKGAAAPALDVTIVAVPLVTVAGKLTGLSEEALGKVGIDFAADAIYVPSVTLSGDSYTAVLEKGVTYALTVSGVNDYELTSGASVTYDTDATADIVLAPKPTYKVAIAPEGADVADLANATFTFQNLNEEGYVYTFTGTEGIALRDGVYSVTVGNSGKFVQKLTSNLTISGADTVKTIRFTDEVTSWNFSDASFTGQGDSWNGLTFTNGQKNKTYLLSGAGTISVPVSGPCKIIASACYEYSFFFAGEDEPSVGQKTGSTSKIESFTCDYTGEAGYVDIHVLGTSYLTSIEVVKTLPYQETLTVGAENCDYTAIGAALDAIRRMERPNGERVTILVQPGNYEEMLVVDVPNVTLKNASETPSIALTNKGVDIDENAVRVTWYYGHGYTYASMGSDCKFDAEVLEVNRENGYPSFTNPGAGTTSGSYWNASVVIAADGFRAEGIIFENSFNQYISAAAANDVLTAQASAKEGATPRAELPAGSTAVQDKAYVERAAALAIANNCKEISFENCKFISHQDTLYGGTGVTAAFYDCDVLGGTDYIFGGMTAVFAKCDLVFNTSENKNDVGYITAPQQSEGRGYLMYNCRVTSTTPGVDTASEFPSKPGYFGRPWAPGTSEAIFYNTIIDATCENWYDIDASLIRADGWLSTLSGESPLCGEYGTYELAEGVDHSADRVKWAAVFAEDKLADGTPIAIENWLGGWNAFDGKDLTILLPDGKVNNAPAREEADAADAQPAAEPFEHHFASLTQVAPGNDKDPIAEGTAYDDGFFVTQGKVTLRFSEGKGGVYAIEIGKNLSGALAFTLPSQATVKLVVSSTGGSNTSAVAILDAAGNVVDKVYEVSTTDTTELVYAGLAAGEYRIVSPQSDYNRGYRLMTVDVVSE